MIRLKQHIKIFSLFVLLFVVVSVPAFFIEYQNDHSFNKTVLYPVDAVHFGSDDDSHSNNPPTQDYSIRDRIKLIGSSGVVIQSADDTDLQANDNLQENLLPVMEEQLMLLQAYNALPVLSFSDVVTASFSRKTYMDVLSITEGYTNISNTRSMVGIWEIQAEYQDFYVLAYMDADTSALYDITILSKSSSFLYSPPIHERGFGEYLQLFSNGSNESNDVFTVAVDSYYDERMIWLYPVLINDQTGQLSPCRIGNSEIKIYEWGLPLDSEPEIVEVPTTAN